MDIMKKTEEMARKAKLAASAMANLSTSLKNKALLAMAKAIQEKAEDIISKNRIDVKEAKEKGLAISLIDRLTVNDKRISNMSKGLREIAELPDPVGEVIEHKVRPNGLRIDKVRVPLGVVAIIYESRPNVTCDAAGLCLKAGNAVILRGGSEAINSNMIIAKVLQEAAYSSGIPQGAIQLVETTDREAVSQLVKMDGFIDVVIPRGSEEMIKKIKANATVPVIGHGKGLCHIYVDKSADLRMAERICFNAKVQRPGVCNAMETLLVHKDIAGEFLPGMIKKFEEAKVEIRGDEKTKSILSHVKSAREEDWSTEYLDLILSVKVVDSLSEAIDHINKYGSMHSEAILARDKDAAQKFLKEVDASSVFWNASTRFTDGGEFGMGAEIGISNQKLHARGPMGVRELTSTKFVIYGDGQIRE
ncbi:glutamate-5-semialdehyde dehydrogenase [bacterium]|nr:glutamate-5-semialdehyde dehydrogenase [bacterium]NIO18833.1 glutamate-5-semialdehyde dehydrogenase [bacterium]